MKLAGGPMTQIEHVLFFKGVKIHVVGEGHFISNLAF